MTQSSATALLARIQALRARTTDRGCTEQEALAAAVKVAELLDRHGLSIVDLEREAHPCVRGEVRTERSRAGPLDECGPAVAALFESRFWFEPRDDGRLSHVFLGLPADVEAATYLMGLIGHAFETEGNRFRASKEYTQGRGGRRRALHTSFMLGLSEGVQAKLEAMRAAREAASRGSPGRDVVVAKASIVDAEMERLGLRFRSRAVAKRFLNPGAYRAGHAAGERLRLDQEGEQEA